MNDLKHQEVKLLVRIEELGLVRDVRYDLSEEVIKLGFRGVTEVRLYTQVEWQKNRKNRDGVGENHVAFGSTYCSRHEKQFSKQMGRLIATGRALKRYEHARTCPGLS